MNLPHSVREIAEVIGVQQALFLIGQLPRWCSADKSRRIILYVPHRMRADDRLVRILGIHDAMKLHAAFRGELLHVANCQGIYKTFRDKSIAQLSLSGMKNKDIAEVMGVSERHVRGILAGEKPHEECPQGANDNRRTFARCD